MGESACLMQSFSHASDTTNEAKEGNPVHSLGESISFGRFMSESLDWEKWSSFSHNRYLEESEKYTRPGSVAQMKAYFEAYYKRTATKKAVPLLDQTNVAANNAPQPKIEDGAQQSVSLDVKLEGSNSHVRIDETQVAEAQKGEASSTLDLNGYNRIVEKDELEAAKVEIADKVIEDQVVEENHMLLTSPNQLGDAGKLNEVAKMEPSGSIQMEKSPVKEIISANQETLPSATKTKSSFSSSKPSLYSRASKAPSSPVKFTTPVHTRKENSATPKNKKSARDLTDKKRSTPKSLCMSINFTLSCACGTNKSSPVCQGIGDSRLTGNSSKTAKYQSTVCTSDRASTKGSPQIPSLTPQLENKRIRLTLDHGVSGSRKANSLTQSLSVEIRTRSPTVFSPFSLRSDERSTKRKEKLEKKLNTNEGQKMQQSKEKAKTELKRLHQSLSFKAKPMPDFRETELPKNQIKKIPLTHPRSPKLGRKPSYDTVQDASSLLLPRPPVKNNNCKHVMVKNIRGQVCSVTLLHDKNAQENSSPNIQH
ncbi:PREDICTED: protein WVD2-like 7 isoform X2 [Nelumbo nucifera]|uniref:TPX2 C-terminal domain-containing protein n=2 Tax=Nelumbo nucifera TaxID=4432 RepID=A0A822YJH6_NELNU|nr:PREDICTED: protein WVD2-like 7 isoform X2 [Nelumbo nucifera]DAD34344.1 TPA_asm: hypothetical protein HUJ06_004984 [Nelumbo nucifera]